MLFFFSAVAHLAEGLLYCILFYSIVCIRGGPKSGPCTATFSDLSAEGLSLVTLLTLKVERPLTSFVGIIIIIIIIIILIIKIIKIIIITNNNFESKKASR
jgi:hypothetical protein